MHDQVITMFIPHRTETASSARKSTKGSIELHMIQSHKQFVYLITVFQCILPTFCSTYQVLSLSFRRVIFFLTTLYRRSLSANLLIARGKDRFHAITEDHLMFYILFKKLSALRSYTFCVLFKKNFC